MPYIGEFPRTPATSRMSGPSAQTSGSPALPYDHFFFAFMIWGRSVAPAPMMAAMTPMIDAITAGLSNIPPDEAGVGCTVTAGAVVVTVIGVPNGGSVPNTLVNWPGTAEKDPS